MISPMDPQTKKFYMEMGYSEQQIIKAYEYSIRKKIDILDALSQQSQSAPPPPPPSQKLQNKQVQQAQPQKNNNTPFLTPISQIKGGDYETLYSRSSKFNPLNSKYELRELNNPVGLLNISNCCYLNSLIQCYFLMGKFKEILLSAEPLENIAKVLADNKTKLKRVKNQYELLAKLKKFFTVMSLTSKKYLDPSEVLQNLVDSVGEKLTYGEQKDLSQINIMVTERLSEGLTFSKKFFIHQEPENPRTSFIDEGDNKNRFNSIFNPEGGVIKQLFYGTKVEYYQKEVENQQPIVSDFTGLILNPGFGTLENALDEEFNFSVEIKGETFEKQMFIREEPEYLFLYINRTEYDREEQQMLKNDQKFLFDFVLYLDRYLEKYKKQRDQKDERIKKLINSRNTVKEQISSLQILFKKMEECYCYARQLEGWVEKLPSQEEFEEQRVRLSEQLGIIQQELKQIESRKEQYHLMYIFVHRGDAVSGHYWGYGRNGANWYRFDINCRLIPQDQIIIDMEKSSGTPYALVYVKKDNIPQFQYDYHNKLQAKNSAESAVYRYYDQKLADQIIRENIILHQQLQAKNNSNIKKKCFNDYVGRYNALKRTIKKFSKPKSEMNQLDGLSICNNFSFFLYSKQQVELFKFSVFEQSLLFASGNRITIEKLMHEGDLLASIQKKFKMKCKGELHLKNYAVVGKDLDKYVKLQQQYQLTIFQVIWAITIIAQFDKLLPLVQKSDLKDQFTKINTEGPLEATLSSIFKYLKIRIVFLRSEQYQKLKQNLEGPLYITQVNNEITKLIMLQLVVDGFRFESLQKFVELTDAAGSQIAAINSSNVISTNAFPEIQSSLSVVYEIQELIKMFFAKNRKNSTSESAAKTDRRSSSKQNSNFQSASSGSPLKSVAFNKVSSSRQKKHSESKLTPFSQSQLLLLDIRQSWKIEQLENWKANFELSERVVSLLKRVGPIVKLYRRVQELERALSAQQLKEAGIVLNQPRQAQSLI